VTGAEICEFAPGDETAICAGHNRAFGRERLPARFVGRLVCFQTDNMEMKIGTALNRLERPNSADHGVADSDLV
jgi:hypothetical protein